MNHPLRTIDVAGAIKKQSDTALILSNYVFSTKAKHCNAVFSPASINAVLTMAVSGPGGHLISEEILSFLKLSSIDELNAVFSKIVSVVFADRSANGAPKISSVNGVWMEQTLPIDPSFEDLFESFFKIGFSRVDFRNKFEEVRLELNKWAENHTNGLIKDLLPPRSITEKSKFVYGNALYFKGAWEVSFDKSYTKDGEFYLLNGTSVSVPFMSSDEKQYIQAYDGFKVLRLPYRQGFPLGHGTGFSFGQGSSFRGDPTNSRLSMFFYLPDKNDGLDDLVETMASTSGFLDSHIPSRKESVCPFIIPKFKIDYSLNNQDMGLHSVPVCHKAFVEIDEEGTEAAAASFAGSYGGIPKYMNFVADHPFLFSIREDKTGTVLFVGQIFNPSIRSS